MKLILQIMLALLLAPVFGFMIGALLVLGVYLYG